MPFTISHAAAALPVRALSRGRLPLAALMIGCMAPDFAYFLPDFGDRMESHSLAGQFTFCLPVGLAVWLFYVHVLERPTRALLTPGWRARLPPPTRVSRRSLALAALAVLLGAATHVAWDYFTHANTPVSRAFPVFHAPTFDVGTRTLPLFFVLQLASSVVGLAVLAGWAWLRLRLPPPPGAAPDPVSNRQRVLALGGILLAAAGCAWLNSAGDAGSVRLVLFDALIGAMLGSALGWTLVALYVTYRGRRARALRPARAE